MNRIKTIRERLHVTQAELAAGLGRSQGNVAFYEKGQTVPPEVAKSLIVFARTKGHEVTYIDIYGPADSPAANDADTAQAHQPAEQGAANA